MCSHIAYVFIITLCLSSEVLGKSKARRYTHGNKDSFDDRTYGGYLTKESYQIITPRKYRSMVEENLVCNDKYCNNGNWGCRRGDNRNCFNVEHIIDLHGPEYSSHQECKNVAGNMIMAHGDWNQELGTVARSSYKESMNEKIATYGEQIVTNARHQIERCIQEAKRANEIDVDITENITENTEIQTEYGLLIIPVGSNITCYGCNDTNCEECTCDMCSLLPYVELDESTVEAIGIAVCVGIIIVSVLFGAMITGIISVIIIKRRYNKYVHTNSVEQL